MNMTTVLPLYLALCVVFSLVLSPGSGAPARPIPSVPKFEMRLLKEVFGENKIRRVKNKSKRLHQLRLRMRIVKDYLLRFGYLSAAYSERALHYGSLVSSDNRVLRTGADMRRALRKFQKLVGLRTSGILNRKTYLQIKTPRCANRDFPVPSKEDFKVKDRMSFKIHRNGLAKWRSRFVSYKITNYPSKGKLNHSVIDEVFSRAFLMWSIHLPIRFYRVLDKNAPADIVIFFQNGYHGDGVPFDGQGGVLAHAFYPSTFVGPNSDSLAGDMHFDDDEVFSYTPPGTRRDSSFTSFDSTDLLAVAAHELGHSLGLEHSAKEEAIMYPLFHRGNQLGHLHQDDIDGIQKLYCSDRPAEQCGSGSGGDYPTIPTPPQPTAPPPPAPTTLNLDIPNPCDTRIDAILNLRKIELQFFKGEYFWRVIEQETGQGAQMYQLYYPPRSRENFWEPLPDDIGHIDAVYERNIDSAIFFFRGKRFWVMSSNLALVHECPPNGFPLTDLGLPEDINKVDAMFSWNDGKWKRSERVFLFSGDNYWRYEELQTRCKPQYRWGCVVQPPWYPRRIADTWIGVPTPVDTAYTHEDRITFFFKDGKVYQFNNVRMRVDPTVMSNSDLNWVGCAATERDRMDLLRSDKLRLLDSTPSSSAGHYSQYSYSYYCIISLTLLAFFDILL